MSGSTVGSRGWLGEWEARWVPVIALVPYLLLAVLAGFTAAQKHASSGSVDIDLGLCAAAALWMLWMYTLHPAWRNRLPVMLMFVLGLIAITATLVIRDPWFGFFTVACYFFSFNALPRLWDLPCVALTAIVAATAQASGIKVDTAVGAAEFFAVVLVNVLPMSGMAWAGWNDEIQRGRREKALTDVREANRRLEATLVENAGLHEQLVMQAREAGVLDERARMAREIHDTLAQGLAGIVTQLQAAEFAADDPEKWRRHFAAATGLARESLSEARRSVDALRPEQLESARLDDALAGVAERWSALHGIAVQVTTTGTARPLSPEAELALLRMLQEALANVAKHARASRAVVTLSYLESEVALDVSDDGRGFDVDVTEPVPEPVPVVPVTVAGDSDGAGADGAEADPGAVGGFGLVAMRQRIESLFGTLQVESEPGVGTTVSACVPQQTAGART